MIRLFFQEISRESWYRYEAVSVGKVAGKIPHLSQRRRGARELIDWDKIAVSTQQMEAHCSIESTGWFSMGYSPLCKPQLDTHTFETIKYSSKKYTEDQSFVSSIFQIKLFLYHCDERYPNTICRDAFYDHRMGCLHLWLPSFWYKETEKQNSLFFFVFYASCW